MGSEGQCQDVDEFLNWVHPGRELKMLRAEVRDDKVLTLRIPQMRQHMAAT